MKKIFKSVVHVAIGIMVFVLAIWFADFITESAAFQEKVLAYGYVGAFFIAVLSGFNFLVPIPAISFLPSLLAAGLNFWLSIIVITLGMTVGDSIGFVIGKMGRQMPSFKNSRILDRLEGWQKKHHLIPIIAAFIWATIVPLPNELIVIPLAIIGYKYWHFIPAVFAGNLIFNTYAAFGITNLFEAIFK